MEDLGAVGPHLGAIARVNLDRTSFNHHEMGVSAHSNEGMLFERCPNTRQEHDARTPWHPDLHLRKSECVFKRWLIGFEGRPRADGHAPVKAREFRREVGRAHRDRVGKSPRGVAVVLSR